MLPQILPQLQSCSTRKHHVRHHQIDAALTLQVKLHRLPRVLRRHNFKARALQNAGGRLPHKRLVLNQKNGALPGLLVRLYPLLKSHTPSNSLFSHLFFEQAHSLAALARSARSAPTSLPFGYGLEILFGIYFAELRIVCFGSSTILRAPLGALSRNAVSAPSANTSPRKTSALLGDVVAYTGTAVTRSSGASFCTITPVTVVTSFFSVKRTSRAFSSGIAVPSIQPSRNHSNLGRFSYQSGRGNSSSKTSTSSCVLTVFPAYRSLSFRSARKNGSSGFASGCARPFLERDNVSASRSMESRNMERSM